MIVQVADGVREAELRSIPAVQAVERLRDGCYHLKVAGSIDLVIKRSHATPCSAAIMELGAGGVA